MFWCPKCQCFVCAGGLDGGAGWRFPTTRHGRHRRGTDEMWIGRALLARFETTQLFWFANCSHFDRPLPVTLRMKQQLNENPTVLCPICPRRNSFTPLAAFLARSLLSDNAVAMSMHASLQSSAAHRRGGSSSGPRTPAQHATVMVVTRRPRGGGEEEAGAAVAIVPGRRTRRGRG